MAYQLVFVESAALLIALIIVAMWAPTPLLFNLLVIVGYPHFLIAFLYQWRAGKLSIANIVALVCFAIAGVLFILKAPIVLQAAIVGSYFLAHHFFDEFRLLGIPTTGYRMLMACAPLLLYAALLVERLYTHIHFLESWMFAFAVVIIAVLSRIYKRATVDAFGVYMITVTVLLWVTFASFPSVHPIILIGVPILYHYMKWYLHSYKKLEKKHIARMQYVRIVIVTNLACISLFLFSQLWATHFPILGALFAESTFYLLAFLHISSSFFQLVPARV